MYNSTVSIDKGTVIVYRVFDIAEEVSLLIAERILRQQKGESRLTLAPNARNAVIIKNAPIRFSLGETNLSIDGELFKADTIATVWDYGALSIAFHIPLPVTTWDHLMRFSAILNEDTKGRSKIDDAAQHKAEEISTLLQEALKKPSEWHVSEDYVIFFLEQVSSVSNHSGGSGNTGTSISSTASGMSGGSQLVKEANVPGLLLGEPTEVLASKNRDSILEHVYQYAANDLVVIDWNSAIILEPSGQKDIADVLEFALTHLLEVRYYDDLLDKRLSELYDVLEDRRAQGWRAHFSNISHETNTRYIEFTEFMERIDNSLKVVGDFYLAVIFRAAVRRFRIPDWQQSITRKMNLLARVSELLQGEVNVQRGHILEIIIIFLILFEILSAVFKNLSTG